MVKALDLPEELDFLVNAVPLLAMEYCSRGDLRKARPLPLSPPRAAGLLDPPGLLASCSAATSRNPGGTPGPTQRLLEPPSHMRTSGGGPHQFARDERVPNSSSSVLSTASKSR